MAKWIGIDRYPPPDRGQSAEELRVREDGPDGREGTVTASREVGGAWKESGLVRVPDPTGGPDRFEPWDELRWPY